MKNLRFVCIIFFFSNIKLAQSYKEMIAILNNKMDSLHQIVASERTDKQKLNIEILNLKSQIKELELNKENLSTDKNALETKKQCTKQTAKNRKDNLVIVTTELLKYRSVPKRSNYWWSSTENDTYYAWSRHLNSNVGGAG